MTACVHSTSAKSLQEESISSIDSISEARVAGISGVLSVAVAVIPPFSYRQAFKTMPLWNQVCAGSLRSNPVERKSRTRVPGLFLPIFAFAGPSGVQTLFLLQNDRKLI